MFERITQLAEHAATKVSRRKFLGQLGQAAMLVAAAAGGLLALPGAVQAAPRLCDNATSESGCWYRKVGDPCISGRGSRGGRCRAVRGTTACYCDER